MELKTSAAVTLAVTAGMVCLVGCCHTGPGGGDEPIIMAGGSMRFITRAQRFEVVDPLTKLKWSHKNKNGKITQVDILFSDKDVPAVEVFPVQKQTKIAIDYCDGSVLNGSCTGKKDTVYVQYNAGQGIEISAPNAMQNPNSNVLDYPPPGKISQIRIDTKTYDCPSQAKEYCLLVIHYQ